LPTGLLILPGVACSRPATGSTLPGGASPQEVVEKVARAGESGNFAEFVNCIEPKGRIELSSGLLAGVTMMIAFMGAGEEMMGGLAEGMAEAMTGEELPAEKAIRERFAAVLEKHNLPNLTDENATLPEGEAKEKLFADLDHGVFLTDLLGVMKSLDEGKGGADECRSGAPRKSRTSRSPATPRTRSPTARSSTS
jgi:hypothetical protein